jgi:disulfide bond formation protein DsbB
MMLTRLRVALAVSALTAGVALGIARGSEIWGDLVPCALCLVERWPYRVALWLAAIGLVLPRPLARWALWLVLLAAAAGGLAAFVHVGVEHGWWASPLPQCQAPNIAGMSIAERLKHLPSRPSMACEDPTYLLPSIPLSMAEMNMLFALAFTVGVASFLWRTRRSEP